MKFTIDILIIGIALLHLFFMYMEVIAWTSLGKTIFRGIMPKEMFEKTKIMAANQGIYNSFLSFGLLWSFYYTSTDFFNDIRFFFLTCILIAGVYGGITISKKVFLVQGLPALITIILIYLFQS